MLPHRSTTRTTPSTSICGAMSGVNSGRVSGRSPLPLSAALFPPQVVSGLAAPPAAACLDEPASASPQTVLQGYAQVLQACLGRTSQSPFDLAGVQVYSDVEAILQSLARCRAQHDDATFQ